MNQQKIIDNFHKLYYESESTTWKDTRWLGTPAQKTPSDLWIYQEIMYELRPDTIIECGTYDGGSAHFLASICDLLNNGKIFTIDIEPQPNRPVHPRITYLTGSSTDPSIVSDMYKQATGTVLVILDSDHSYQHVLDECNAYHSLVSPNSYMIVEDSNVNGHPVLEDFGPGPMEALEQFIKEHDEFEIDESREKFLVTFNPKGFLRRKN